MKKHHTISLTLLALVLAVGLFSLYQNIGGGKLAIHHRAFPYLYPPGDFRRGRRGCPKLQRLPRRHHDHTSVCRWCFFQRKGQLGRTI